MKKRAYTYIVTACLALSLALPATPARSDAANSDDGWLTEENWNKPRQPPAAPPPATAKPDPAPAPVAPPPATAAALADAPDEPPAVADTGRGGQFIFSPAAGFSTIDATDIAANESSSNISDYNYGAEFYWVQAQTENIDMRITAGIERFNYDPAPGKLLAEATPTLWTLGIGGDYFVNDWLVVEADIFAKHEAFVRRVAANSFTIDRLVIPQARGGIRLLLGTVLGLDVEIGASGNYYYERSPTNASSQVEHGFGFGGMAALYRRVSAGVSLGVRGTYTSRLQDTETTLHTDNSYHGRLDIIFDL